MERLWRTAKYEEVCLKAYSGGRGANFALVSLSKLYNSVKPWGTAPPPRCSIIAPGYWPMIYQIGGGRRPRYWHLTQERRALSLNSVPTVSN